MKNKKFTRTCIGCKQKKSKQELIRIVKNKEKIKVDLNQKIEGRGEYICKDIKCFEKALKRNKLKVDLKLNKELRGVMFD